MQDRLLALWHAIEVRIRVVTPAVFGVLLLTVLALKALESDQSSVSEAALMSAKKSQVSATTATAALVASLEERLSAKRQSIERSTFAPLITNSMFDVKAVLDAIALEAQANRRFEDALRLYNERKYRESLEVCKEVLSIRSGHIRAQQLKTTLEEKLKEAGVFRSEVTPAQLATPAGSDAPTLPVASTSGSPGLPVAPATGPGTAASPAQGTPGTGTR